MKYIVERYAGQNNKYKTTSEKHFFVTPKKLFSVIKIYTVHYSPF